MSSMGEIIGAQIYLTETIKRPIQYSAVSFASNFSTVGSMAALAVAAIATSPNYCLTWRIAFAIGACVALVGSYSSKLLRETPEFADARKRIKLTAKHSNKKVNLKTLFAYFFIECSYPVWFYITYVYLGQVLKNQFGLTGAQVIQNNLYVSIIGSLGCFVIVYIVRTVHPFKILNVKLAVSFLLALGFLLMDFMTSPLQIMLLQMLIITFKTSSFPAMSLFFKHFPVLHRFKSGSMAYAMSRAIMSVISTFGIIYLVRDYGYYAICAIIIPMIIGYWIALNYFKRLEKEDLDEKFQALKSDDTSPPADYTHA
jgi:MHS family proline/betaine transporter-like MFS transporter